ncbi:MAG: hypothetical protein LBS89_02645, partial [Zoogloeaceae bacterium]|nr:hypothetical protein [Zoogloeaceae bacterium]
MVIAKLLAMMFYTPVMKTKNPFATIADGMESLDVDDAGFIAGTIMVIYLVGFLIATGFMGMV